MNPLDQWEADSKEMLKKVGNFSIIYHYENRIIILIDLIRKKDEALKFYANCSYHSMDLLSFPSIHKPSDYIIDNGSRAKGALALNEKLE